MRASPGTTPPWTSSGRPGWVLWGGAVGCRWDACAWCGSKVWKEEEEENSQTLYSLKQVVPQAHSALYLHQNFVDSVEAAAAQRSVGPASAAALRQLVQLHGVALLLEVSADLLEGGYATGAPEWWRRRAVWWRWHGCQRH